MDPARPVRILFVDDEPRILGGLRNSLRRYRREWDVSFAESGEAALAALAAAPFDVLVTDVRMPGMDGGVLLHEVRDRYPAVMRVVLSGEAGRDQAVRALAEAHQYLSKPCDTEALHAAVARVTALAPLLGDPAILRVVGAIDRLPSVPRAFAALSAALASPAASMADIARVVASDPAMTVKILQIANSAYFGPGQAKVSLETAVTFLGLDLVKALALTANVFAALEGRRLGGLSLEAFQRTAILGARLARGLAPAGASAERAFTAALVHDVGQVVLAVGLPDRYEEVRWLARDAGVPLQQAEQETLGVAHPAVGAYLLGAWGLPLELVALAAGHHAPPAPGAAPDPLLAAVQVGTALAGEALGGDAALHAGPLEEWQLAALGPGLDLPRWRRLAADEAALLLRRPQPEPEPGA